MVKYSVLNEDIKQLCSVFGEENIFLQKKNTYIFIKVPDALLESEKAASWLIQIPRGYGYGNGIHTIFFTMPQSIFPDITPAVQSIIQSNYTEKFAIPHKWFWINIKSFPFEFLREIEGSIENISGINVIHALYVFQAVLKSVSDNSSACIEIVKKAAANYGAEFEKIQSSENENELIFVEKNLWMNLPSPVRI